MKNIINKINHKINTALMNAKFALTNNKGMEVVQVLILVILGITLGALLLATLKTEFGTQLTTVGERMTAMFS